MESIHLFYPDKIGNINKDIYGFFIEHIAGMMDGGIFVGEDSDIPNINGIRKELIEKMRQIKTPLLRWGGCTNELYDWRDGIGPRKDRPISMGCSYLHCGKTQVNDFGTHEFSEFCDLVGADKYITLNVAGASPLDAFHWIEYCNGPEGMTSLTKLRAENGSPQPLNIKYWGIGNENNEYGGLMTAEEYSALYNRVVSLSYSVLTDKHKTVASGCTWVVPDYCRRFLKSMSERGLGWGCKRLDGYSLHCYTLSDNADTDFSEEQWYECLNRAKIIERNIKETIYILNEFDPKNKVKIYVDEWGNWSSFGTTDRKPYLFQPGTMRDAVHAAMNLNIFNNYCDYVEVGCLTSLLNYIHSPFLSNGEQLIQTPTFYVFDMMKEHQNAECIRTVTACEKNYELDRIYASASLKDGKTLLTLVNTVYDTSTEVSVNLHNCSFPSTVEMEILSSDDPHNCNTFDDPYKVGLVKKSITASGNTLVVTIPAASVISLRFETPDVSLKKINRTPSYDTIKQEITHYSNCNNIWN